MVIAQSGIPHGAVWEVPGPGHDLEGEEAGAEQQKVARWR